MLDWVATIQCLQVLSGLAWLGLLALFTPALWRVLHGRADLIDLIRAPKWFVALVMVLGSVRWLTFRSSVPHMTGEELAFWALVYVINIGAAGGVAYAWHLTERLRR